MYLYYFIGLEVFISSLLSRSLLKDVHLCLRDHLSDQSELLQHAHLVPLLPTFDNLISDYAIND